MYFESGTSNETYTPANGEGSEIFNKQEESSPKHLQSFVQCFSGK